MVEFETLIPVVISEPETDTGFPFDDTDDDFPRTARRSRLVDDIAARHPEFADTLRAFNTDFPSTFRSNTWGRKRHPSGSCGEDDSRSQASGFSSSSNESNPNNIIESEFPEYFRSKLDSRKPPPCTRHQEKSEQEEGNKTQRNNTVDLGKKQQSSLDEGSRGQRSMSAPPDNRNNQQPPQRFVSRINIDPLIPPAAPQQSQQQQMGANASSAPKSPKNDPQPQQQKQPNVRHIPIFVEGRDEPVLPKNIHPEPPTQERRYFGEDPPTFNKFFNKGGQPQKTQPVFTSHHEFIPKNQQPSYQQQQQQPSYQQQPQQPSYQQQQPHYQHQPHNFQQQPNFQQQAQHPSFQQQPQQPSFEQQQNYQKQHQQNQRQQTPPPKPGPLDPIGKIQLIQKDVLELMTQVENFKGASRKDKQYLYLDEMLTRNLLKLDNIETEGKENIRLARKEAIKCIEKCISILEAKADSAAAAAAMNTENVNQQVEETQQTMEVEPVTTTEDQILGAGVTGTEQIDNKQLSKNLMEAEKKQEQQEILPVTNELQTANKQEEQKTEVKQETTETPEKMETEPVIPVTENVTKVGGDTNENSKTESDTNKATKADQKSVEKSPKKKGKSKVIKKDLKNDESKMDVEVTENKNDNKMEVEVPSSNQGDKPVEDASQKPKAAKPVEETKNIT